MAPLAASTIDRRPDNSFSGMLGRQTQVIRAIMLRELHSRYGRHNIGYLWMIGEPMMLATVITLIHLAQPSHITSDIAPAPFAIIGYTIFIIFRGVFNRAGGLVEGNAPLFFYRPVSLFDVIFARSIIDMAGCFLVMVIMLSLSVAFGYANPPYRPLYLLSAAALMCWWSFALAMIAACLTYKSEAGERQLHVISYFCIPLSGAFWQFWMLPDGFRAYLEWFPMPLIFEQARYGQFRSAPSEFVSPGYVSAWCAGLTLVGFILIRRLRHRL